MSLKTRNNSHVHENKQASSLSTSNKRKVSLISGMRPHLVY
ncbi:hypothetical protein VCHA48O428_20296 [Vibrio chagasii]|nr:hypothetical protein VCHA48O428_20296 [Vibrio chagasii]